VKPFVGRILGVFACRNVNASATENNPKRKIAIDISLNLANTLSLILFRSFRQRRLSYLSPIAGLINTKQLADFKICWRELRSPQAGLISFSITPRREPKPLLKVTDEVAQVPATDPRSDFLYAQS
jgi:hypothetical protein